MALIQSLVDSSKYGIKCPYAMSPIGICVHNTANDAPARNEASYMKSNNNEVSFHVAVDDVESIQVIPFNRNAWAAGDGASGSGNRKYIHFEICYSRSGGAKFIEAEKRAAKEIAALLKSYGWSISNVKKHQDFSGKYCPHRTLDTGWQRFLDMIKKEMSASTTPSTGTMYRVVVGSFSDRKNAEAQQAKLKAAGYSSFLDAFKKDGKTFFRVIAGSYKDRVNADKVVAELKAKGFDPFVAIYGDAPNTTTPVKPEPPKPTPPPQPVGDREIKRYSEKGKCTVTTSTGIKFRDKPCTSTGKVIDLYYKGESVTYDLVVVTEKYTWISWVGASSGTRRYMPITDRSTGEKWANCV